MNFKFKKSLGQNFLTDQNIIHKIVDSANIDDSTLLLEVGPGGGAITKYMVPLCGHALLYEADSRLEKNLNELLKNNHNYTIKIGDFLETNLEEDINNYSYSKLYLVANLPYYITTPIIMKFINEEVFPDKIVIMVQKEVANRLAASVGTKNYGALTVFLDYFYEVKKLFDVSKNCFIPCPNVDSAVICMNLKGYRPYVKDMMLFKKIIRDAFRYKRKNLRNNFKGYNLEEIDKILKENNLTLNSRAEDLDLEIFILIANRLSK